MLLPATSVIIFPSFKLCKIMKLVNLKVSKGKNKKVEEENFSNILSPSLKKNDRREKWRNVRKVLLKILAGFFIFLVISSPFVYFFLYSPALKLINSASGLVQEANEAKEIFNQQDLVSLKGKIEEIETKFNELQDQYNYFSFLRFVPIAKGYYTNGEHVLNAAETGIPLAKNLLNAAEPIADVFGYKTASGEHDELSGQEKIETIIRNMPDINVVLSESTPKIDSILFELNEINPKYLPENIQGYNLRKMYNDASIFLKDGKGIFQDLQDVLVLLPGIAGSQEKKTYLILFQNDKEIRPTGGFLTAFGYAEVENGVLGKIVSEDIYNLDQQLYNSEPAPKEIREYLNQYRWFIRDSNIYPDLVDSSKKFEEKYQNQRSPRPFDGIIYIDTQFVEEIMKEVGPIEMTSYGETITDENVVYQLELYSEKLLSGGSDRKQFMEDLMGEMMKKVIEARRDQWGGLIKGVLSSMKSKHLLFYFHDPLVQRLVSDYGFAGRIDEEWDWDYLHISESNMGGLKSNLYVSSTVTQNVEISTNGEITKTVKIHWENPEPGDHWLNGPYRAWVRVYVPAGSTLISRDLKEREINSEWGERDYNKTVFENIILVPTAEKENSEPGTFDLEFSYKIPVKLPSDYPYKLKIQKQPGKSAEKYIVNVNGVLQEILLDADTELEFSR